MEAEMGLKINFPDHIMGGFGADGFWPSGTTPLSWMTPLKDTGSWEGESRLGVSSQNRAMFDRELLGSQTTHRNEPVLFGISLPWEFQKVQAHFCGMSVSRAIRGWSWSIFAKFIENLKSTKMAKWEIDEIF